MHQAVAVDAGYLFQNQRPGTTATIYTAEHCPSQNYQATHCIDLGTGFAVLKMTARCLRAAYKNWQGLILLHTRCPQTHNRAAAWRFRVEPEQVLARLGCLGALFFQTINI
jgi:hypothetical protein